MALTRLTPAALVALSLAPPALAQETMTELYGTWQSQACELRPQPGQDGVQPWYLTREVTFWDGHFKAHFTSFADATCTTPLLDLKFGGDTVIQGASDVAPGAKNVDLIVNDFLTVTPRLDGFTDVLNSAGSGECGTSDWVLGVEQDVFESGCSVLGVAPNTPTFEYEVLYVSAGMLYFGARPIDGSSLDGPDTRPTALQIPLKLAEGGATQRIGAGDIREPTHVEIVTFRQVEGADPKDVRAFFNAITDRMNQNDTLLYRTVAQGPDGTWLCINYWTSRDDMEVLNTQAQSWKDEFATMRTLADPSSFTLTSYAIGN